MKSSQLYLPQAVLEIVTVSFRTKKRKVGVILLLHYFHNNIPKFDVVLILYKDELILF